MLAWHLESQQGTNKNCPPEFLIFSALELPSCGLVVFIDMNIYILIEGRNFKTFLKENYAVALGSYYIFTKKLLKVELNMMLIVLMELAHIRHTWTLHFIL